MFRRAGSWVLLGAGAVVLGFSVVWLEEAFAIPRNIMQWLWIVVMLGALGFAGWTGWGYYRATRDDDEWE
ncbi:MAG: hypothetical protein KBA31_12955 [Alphaproteobacteria bacterium]|nr:hypothetical protein [Alphaproteobacteria bacterium]